MRTARRRAISPRAPTANTAGPPPQAAEARGNELRTDESKPGKLHINKLKALQSVVCQSQWLSNAYLYIVSFHMFVLQLLPRRHRSGDDTHLTRGRLARSVPDPRGRLGLLVSPLPLRIPAGLLDRVSVLDTDRDASLIQNHIRSRAGKLQGLESAAQIVSQRGRIGSFLGDGLPAFRRRTRGADEEVALVLRHLEVRWL